MEVPVANAPNAVEIRANFDYARSHVERIVNPSAPRETTGTEKALFLYAVEKSLSNLAGYASLNFDHVSRIVILQKAVETYNRFETQKSLGDIRPENWLITSGPGVGKSHLVNCIAKAPALREKVTLVSFNMASMRNADDLIQALDEVRNVAITGTLPMLFLDEVDNDDRNFGLLLPLLWDGEIQVGVKKISVRRAVIVAAGSADYFAKRDDEKKLPPKFNDFVSRLKFDEEIPKLTGVDQICIAISLLRSLYKDSKGCSEVLSVPLSLLNFIYRIEFSYGVRSIRHLINYLKTGEKKEDITKDGVLNIAKLKMALCDPDRAKESGLLTHVKDKKGHLQYMDEAIVRDWNLAAAFDDISIPIWCKTFGDLGAPSTWPKDRTAVHNSQLLRELSGDEVYQFVGAGIAEVGVLYFFQKLGEWRHGDSQLRHIFFNLRTIATIIRHTRQDEESLQSLGHEMGVAFGKDFATEYFLEFLEAKKKKARLESLKVETKNENLGLTDVPDEALKLDDLIEEWCKFDISGGWGHWERARVDVGKVGGMITVANSFLVEKAMHGRSADTIKAGEKAPHCAIMRGYISGVLEAFATALGSDAKFDTDETKCGIENFKEEKDIKCKCEFKWSPTKAGPTGKSRS